MTPRYAVTPSALLHLITSLADLLGLFIAMYLSELLVDNAVFGGAVYLLGEVWVIYLRLYNRRGVHLLPASIRSKGLVIFLLTGALTVALVFFFPYLQAKVTAFILIMSIVLFMLQQTITDALTVRLAARGRGLWRLALAYLLFFAAYPALFFLNQWVVGYPIPPDIAGVYLAAFAVSVMEFICQIGRISMDPTAAGETAAEPVSADTLLGVHAYRVYNKMAVNTLMAINLSITAFICYMRFLPFRGFQASLLMLVCWLVLIALVVGGCVRLLQRRLLARYDRPVILFAGLLLWALGTVRLLRLESAGVLTNLISVGIMGVSIGCMLSILLEQSRQMEAVLTLGIGPVDREAYRRNTSAMLDWSQLIACLLLLVMLTLASFYTDGRWDQLEVQYGMQRVTRVIMLVLPLVFILISLVLSLKQPLDAHYAKKLRKYEQQREVGEADPTLEERLRSILVNDYTKRIAVTVLRPLVRPFMPCRVQGQDNVDVSGGPVIFVCNHLELYGPIMAVLHSPFPFRPWVINQMLERETIRAHMRTGIENMPRFIPMRLRDAVIRAVAPLVIWLMRSTDPIAVYRGTVRGVIQTIQQSVEAMCYDDNILLFPEINYQQDGVGDFFTGFVQVARTYYQRTQRRATFYPVYIHKKKRTITYGEGITYNPDNGSGEEKERIVRFLQDSMNAAAQAYTAPSQ